MGLPGFRDLRRRSAAGIFCRVGSGVCAVGADSGAAAAPYKYPVLEDRGSTLASCEKIFQKNLEIWKKTIGIRKKMGYNKV